MHVGAGWCWFICFFTILPCAEEACPTSAKESNGVNVRKNSLAVGSISNKPIIKLDI